MNRTFELRNGIVVEEDEREETMRTGMFIDTYRCVSSPYASTEPGCYIGLKLSQYSMPLGGSYGHGFDVVREVL